MSRLFEEQVQARARAEKVARPRLIIARDTPISTIVEALTEHGCQDLTSQLDSTSTTPLMRGGNGDVYHGILLPQSTLVAQTRVAIKALRVPIHPDDELGKIPKRAARELYTWSRCSHPNVLPLLGLAVLNGELRMVSSWMENGSLSSYLEKNPGIDRYAICVQVCDGLEYLHRVPMIHGDMKGQNVVVSDEGVPIITDFGNAVLQYGDLQFTQTKNVAGFTSRWTAPEILYNGGDEDEDENNGDDGNENQVITQSTEADVYALGMTILEIVTGNVPYAEKKNEISLIYLIVSKKLVPKRPKAHIPSTLRGDALWSLLISCWNPNPAKRPAAREVAKTMKRIADGAFDDVQSEGTEEV